MLNDESSDTELLPDSPLPSPPLRRVTLEVEHHVGEQGWDQPPRLFALVPTRVLAEREPSLVDQLAVSLRDDPDGLTPVEQDALPDADDLEKSLLGIEWPDVVEGCAVVVERLMLPADAEDELPDSSDDLAAHVAEHPAAQEVRLVAAVTRDGEAHSAVRARTPETAALLEGPDLVPGLIELLRGTLT